MSLLVATVAFSCPGDGFIRHYGKNKLSIPISLQSHVDEQKFDELIEKVNQYYAPLVRAEGAELVFKKYWESSTVNARAKRDGNKWTVSMYGGLARHPEVTEDAFLLVLCHEMGHHLGGFPKYDYVGLNWAASEGQSDYWGAHKCMQRVLELEKNKEYVEQNISVPEPVAFKCFQNFISKEEQSICVRTAVAGFSLARLFASLQNSLNDSYPSVSSTDPTQIESSFSFHPPPQCRFDTYMQGALCLKSIQETVHNDVEDEKAGLCTEEFYNNGLRPRCWYRSEEQSL